MKGVNRKDNRNWKEKFFKTVQRLDSEGNPMPDNPPLGTGFWDKPKNTSEILNEQINKRRESKHK